MKKIGLLVIIFLLTGCSNPALPSKVRDLTEFIPVESLELEIKSDFDFIEKNFPKNCVWKKLIRVIDGDTILVEKDERIRFIGIDTPETKDPDRPVQKGGPEASAKTKELLATTEDVCLISDPLGDEIDEYDRTLAYIFSKEGVDVNAELLKIGLARGLFYFPFSRKEEFHSYENQARKEKVGIWK